MSDPFNPNAVPPTTPIDDIGQGAPNNDDRNLAMIAHLSGCAGLIGGGYLGFVGPLVIYLMKKDDSPYVGDQAKEALNFQITLFIAGVAAAVITLVTCGAAFPLLFVVPILQLVFSIIATLAVRDGSPYRYPFNLRLMQ